MRAWVILSVILLVVILGPFFLFEASIHAWVDRVINPSASRGAIITAIVSFLALDVFLPVPSSIVSTVAGALLGFPAGVVASTVGMTLGCVVAYFCGRKYGLPLVRRMVGDRELEEVSASFRSGAEWSLATMRPVPVLAEASALIAGMAGVPFARYLSITALANAGISAVYCAVGVNALATGSFLLAFAGSMALPGCLILCRRLMRRPRDS